MEQYRWAALDRVEAELSAHAVLTQGDGPPQPTGEALRRRMAFARLFSAWNGWIYVEVDDE